MARCCARDQWSAVMVGSALLDAWGEPWEFVRVGSMPARLAWGLISPLQFCYTDDTQMAVAVARGLLDVRPGENPIKRIGQLFALWGVEQRQENRSRAPGATCLSGARLLLGSGAGPDRSIVKWSMGNGAIMRAHPVALAYVGTGKAADVAKAQAGLTHGHPLAACSAGLLVHVIGGLLAGVDLFPLLYDVAGSLERFCDVADTPALKGGQALASYAADQLMVQLETALAGEGTACDVSHREAWTAPDALGVALQVILAVDPLPPCEAVEAAIQMALRINGDSDTVGAIVGALLGARYPAEILARPEVQELEGRHLLMGLGWALHSFNQEQRA